MGEKTLEERNFGGETLEEKTLEVRNRGGGLEFGGWYAPRFLRSGYVYGTVVSILGGINDHQICQGCEQHRYAGEGWWVGGRRWRTK